MPSKIQTTLNGLEKSQYFAVIGEVTRILGWKMQDSKQDEVRLTASDQYLNVTVGPTGKVDIVIRSANPSPEQEITAGRILVDQVNAVLSKYSAEKLNEIYDDETTKKTLLFDVLTSAKTNIPLKKMTREQYGVLVVEAAKSLGWDVQQRKEDKVVLLSGNMGLQRLSSQWVLLNFSDLHHVDVSIRPYHTTLVGGHKNEAMAMKLLYDQIKQLSSKYSLEQLTDMAQMEKIGAKLKAGQIQKKNTTSSIKYGMLVIVGALVFAALVSLR